LEGDIFYIFSDGYVDQFGGMENKKFMYRRFRYLLLTIHNFPVNDQKAILYENFKTWMGLNEQVDDMMVIGFRPFKKEII
jgi:serine phosphatase RsbU (regulator of sigma subunit)